MFSLQKQRDGQQHNIIISNNCAPTMCQMSRVICQVSGVRCQVSGVTIYIYIYFFLQNCGACQERVCYQRGLPRLVFFYNKLTFFVYMHVRYMALKFGLFYLHKSQNSYFCIAGETATYYYKEVQYKMTKLFVRFLLRHLFSLNRPLGQFSL